MKQPTYVTEWYCSAHAKIMKTQTGVQTHKAMSPGRCQISPRQVRKR